MNGPCANERKLLVHNGVWGPVCGGQGIVVGRKASNSWYYPSLDVWCLAG